MGKRSFVDFGKIYDSPRGPRRDFGTLLSGWSLDEIGIVTGHQRAKAAASPALAFDEGTIDGDRIVFQVIDLDAMRAPKRQAPTAQEQRERASFTPDGHRIIDVKEAPRSRARRRRR